MIVLLLAMGQIGPWMIANIHSELCYQFGDRMFKEGPDLIFYSVFLFLGSLWIIPYKAKS